MDDALVLLAKWLGDYALWEATPLDELQDVWGRYVRLFEPFKPIEA